MMRKDGSLVIIVSVCVCEDVWVKLNGNMVILGLLFYLFYLFFRLATSQGEVGHVYSYSQKNVDQNCRTEEDQMNSNIYIFGEFFVVRQQKSPTINAP